MGGVKVSVLGTIVVRGADGGTIGITRDAQRRLLAILACAGTERITTDVLIDRFWRGSPPNSAKGALHTHVSGLRSKLPAGVIVTEDYGYSLDTQRVEIDAWRLTDLADRIEACCRQRSWDEVVEIATVAWKLGDGVPFADLLDDDFSIAARAVVEAARSTIDEAGIEALIQTGRHETALRRAEKLVADQKIRERPWELLARARLGLGRYGEALRCLHDARHALAEVGLEPSTELRAVEQRVLAASSSTDTPRPVLPTPLASFVGRRAEIERTLELLSQHRLTSIVAEGGVGKSRLALEVAHAAARQPADDGQPVDVWFVELASEHSEEVASRVAAAMQLQADGDPVGAIARALDGRPTLLVLDNCEHVLRGVTTLVSTLLTANEHSRVLTTSRLPLGIPGEAIEVLEPLPIPSGDHADEPADSVALFLERARAARPGFDPTADEMNTIGTICRTLRGLPLAIELAAGRLWRTDLTGLVADQQDLAELAPGQHSLAMRATIEWSLGRLPEADADLLTRLSVFRGHFDAQAARAVSGQDGDDLPDRLQALEETALLRGFTVGGQRVYRLLEVVRDALESRVGDELRRELLGRHRAHYARQCAALRLFWVQPPERRVQPTLHRWWSDLPYSIDDVRLAAELPIVGTEASDVDGTADLVGMLSHVAAAEGRHREAIEHLESMLVHSTPIDDELRGLCRSLLAGELASDDQPGRAGVHMRAAVEDAALMPAGYSKVLVLARASLITLILPGASIDDGVALAFDALADASVLDPSSQRRVDVLVATMLARAGREQEARRCLDALLEACRDTPESALWSLVMTAALNVVCLGHHDPEEMERWADGALEFLTEHSSAVNSDLGAWVAFALIRLGRYDDADWIVRTADPIQGYEVVWSAANRARLDLLRGDAASALGRAEQALANSGDYYWEPHLRATAAEAAAVLGDLATVHRHVERLEAHPLRIDDASMLPALRPLVQVEVDVALRSDGHARVQHEAAARAALGRIEQICAASPPDAASPVLPEPVPGLLALARAEVARLGPADAEADAWSSAVDAVRTAGFAQYARRRLGVARERAEPDATRPVGSPVG